MIVDWAGLLGLLGQASVLVALLVIGQLSKRLGGVTRAPRYHLGFYAAAILMGISILARLLNLGRGPEVAAALGQDGLWVLLYIGLPAIAVTLGTIIAWRYWSWLLAERS
jgi:hypothetical protein